MRLHCGQPQCLNSLVPPELVPPSERPSGADGRRCCWLLLMHRVQVVGVLAYIAPSDMRTLQASSGGLTWASGDLSSIGIKGVQGEDRLRVCRCLRQHCRLSSLSKWLYACTLEEVQDTYNWQSSMLGSVHAGSVCPNAVKQEQDRAAEDSAAEGPGASVTTGASNSSTGKSEGPASHSTARRSLSRLSECHWREAPSAGMSDFQLRHLIPGICS